MKQLLRKMLLLVIILFTGSTVTKAEKIEVYGIYYYISSYSNTVSVASPDEGDYSGDIVIPEEIIYNGITYPVTSIGGYAFCYERNVTSVSIPQTVTDIGINAFLDCRSLKSITIPKSVKTIGPAAFEGCSSLKILIFEEGFDDLVFEKHSNAYVSENFKDSPIEDITLGRNIVSQDATSPFGEIISPIKKLIIKNVDAIKSNSYRGLEDTPIVIVPTTEDISKVKDCFQGDVFSSDVAYIPQLKKNYLAGFEFTLWDNIYDNKKDSITDVIVDGKSLTPDENGIYYVDGLMPDSTYDVSVHSLYTRIIVKKLTIILPDGTKGGKTVRDTLLYSNIIHAQFKTLAPNFGIADGEIITQTTYKTVVFASHDKTLSPSEKGFYLRPDYSVGEWVKYKADSIGNVLATGLLFDQIYSVRPYAIYNGKEYTDAYYINMKTQSVAPYIAQQAPYYSVSLVNLEVSSGTLDSGLSVVELGLMYKGENYLVNTDKVVTIDNLNPGQSVEVRPYVKVKYQSTNEIITTYGDWKIYTTKVPTLNGAPEYSVSPTVININKWNTYTLYDGTYKGFGYTSPFEATGNACLFTGLEPNTTYTVTGYVMIEEGNYKAEAGKKITTPTLEMTTLPAKATSNTKAVICAETNLVNEETSTGFEFRRIDAPDLVPSTVVYCAVHDGLMEGILNNLSSNTYYKYRPFYKSASEKMYYGEWIGFGTADAYVYFIPTVHTYATASVENNSVTLNGYALPGSDDILEQGFEYWPEGITRAVTNGVQTVTTTGQRMTITLDNLLYNTTYRYRAYVKTAKETTYGEEQTFTTEANPDGIVETVVMEIKKDESIYNLQGMKMKDKENLPRGIYIQGGKKFVIK